MYINLKKEEKEKLIKTWEILAKRFEKLGYKPTEATEEQVEYINSLVRLLDRKDASTLITFLQILNKREEQQ